MTLVLNVLWFVFGGFITGFLWLLGGCLLALTIVGLPWTMAAFRIGLFAFAPFGRRIEDRRLITGREDLGTGPLGVVLNILWFLLGGWHIALAHVLVGAAQFVTIIGIPFALQNFKLAIVALAPVGKTVVRA
ncbi:MAG: YccF domain-containing protein [Caulobacteraceae bacterium]